MAYTYSVSTRVFAYTVPALILAVILNVPKFLETRIIVAVEHVFATDSPATAAAVVDSSNMTAGSSLGEGEWEESSNATEAASGGEIWKEPLNYTTYTIDVTDLR